MSYNCESKQWSFYRNPRFKICKDMGDAVKNGFIISAMICILTIFAYTNLNYSMVMTTKRDREASGIAIVEIQDESKNRDILVIGILSRSENACIRDAHRKTLIANAKLYTKLDIRVFFVINHKTPELSVEESIHKDIVFLNSTVHCRNRWLGAKYYTWIKYVMTNFPNVSMIGKMDDDAFLCGPHIFDRLCQA